MPSNKKGMDGNDADEDEDEDEARRGGSGEEREWEEEEWMICALSSIIFVNNNIAHL